MTSPDPSRVFVVHGRNRDARDAMFAFLRSIGLNPIEWDQAVQLTGEGSPYIGTILDKAFEHAQAVVVLLTPDEITYLRPEYADRAEDPETQPAAQARPNVLFEAGMAMGRDARRTVLVELGDVRPFSDVVGRHAVRVRDDAASRKSLAQRLETAGCAVDTGGSDWLQAGDLTPPEPPGGGLPLARRVPTDTAKVRIQFDFQHHDRGGGNGRLQLINRGTEDAFDVDFKIPEEAGAFSVHTEELPLARLPAGKSATFMTTRSMGPGKDHFDIHVTARSADGADVSQDVYVNIGG